MLNQTVKVKILYSKKEIRKREQELDTGQAHCTQLEFSEVWIRDGNFFPPRLTRPSPLHLARVFSASQRWWGGDGAKF